MASVSGTRRASSFLVLLALLIFGAFQQQPEKPVLATFGIGLGEKAVSKSEWRVEQRASDLFRKSLAASDTYRIVPFTRTHPSIQRALAEKKLPSELLLPPFTGMVGQEFKVVKLAQIMRADFAVSGTVERLSVSGDGTRATAIVVFELYDVAKGKMAGTTGSTFESSGENEAATVTQLIELIATKGAEESKKLLDEYRAKASGGG